MNYHQSKQALEKAEVLKTRLLTSETWWNTVVNFNNLYINPTVELMSEMGFQTISSSLFNHCNKKTKKQLSGQRMVIQNGHYRPRSTTRLHSLAYLFNIYAE